MELIFNYRRPTYYEMVGGMLPARENITNPHMLEFMDSMERWADEGFQPDQTAREPLGETQMSTEEDPKKKEFEEEWKEYKNFIKDWDPQKIPSSYYFDFAATYNKYFTQEKYDEFLDIYYNAVKTYIIKSKDIKKLKKVPIVFNFGENPKNNEYKEQLNKLKIKKIKVLEKKEAEKKQKKEEEDKKKKEEEEKEKEEKEKLKEIMETDKFRAFYFIINNEIKKLLKLFDKVEKIKDFQVFCEKFTSLNGNFYDNYIKLFTPDYFTKISDEAILEKKIYDKISHELDQKFLEKKPSVELTVMLEDKKRYYKEKIFFDNVENFMYNRRAISGLINRRIISADFEDKKKNSLNIILPLNIELEPLEKKIIKTFKEDFTKFLNNPFEEYPKLEPRTIFNKSENLIDNFFKSLGPKLKEENSEDKNMEIVEDFVAQNYKIFVEGAVKPKKKEKLSPKMLTKKFNILKDKLNSKTFKDTDDFHLELAEIYNNEGDEKPKFKELEYLYFKKLDETKLIEKFKKIKEISEQKEQQVEETKDTVEESETKGDEQPQSKLKADAPEFVPKKKDIADIKFIHKKTRDKGKPTDRTGLLFEKTVMNIINNEQYETLDISKNDELKTLLSTGYNLTDKYEFRKQGFPYDLFNSDNFIESKWMLIYNQYLTNPSSYNMPSDIPYWQLKNPYYQVIWDADCKIKKIKGDGQKTYITALNGTRNLIYFVAYSDYLVIINISKYLKDNPNIFKNITTQTKDGLIIEYKKMLGSQYLKPYTPPNYSNYLPTLFIPNTSDCVYKIKAFQFSGMGGFIHLFKHMKGGQLVDTSNVKFGDTSTEKFKASSDFNEQLQKQLNDEPVPQLRSGSKADRDKYREEMALYNKRKSEKQKEFMGKYKEDILKANDQKFLEAGYTKDKNGRWQKPASLEDVPWLNDVAGAIGARNFLNKAIKTGETFYNKPNLENTIALGKTAVDAWNTGKNLAEKVADPKKLVKDIAIEQGKKLVGAGLKSNEKLELYKNGNYLLGGKTLIEIRKKIKELVKKPLREHILYTLEVKNIPKNKTDKNILIKKYLLTPNLDLKYLKYQKSALVKNYDINKLDKIHNAIYNSLKDKIIDKKTNIISKQKKTVSEKKEIETIKDDLPNNIFELSEMYIENYSKNKNPKNPELVKIRNKKDKLEEEYKSYLEKHKDKIDDDTYNDLLELIDGNDEQVGTINDIDNYINEHNSKDFIFPIEIKKPIIEEKKIVEKVKKPIKTNMKVLLKNIEANKIKIKTLKNIKENLEKEEKITKGAKELKYISRKIKFNEKHIDKAVSEQNKLLDKFNKIQMEEKKKIKNDKLPKEIIKEVPKKEIIKEVPKKGIIKEIVKEVPNKGILKELEEKRERIYKIMFKILSSPSKRSRTNINKELGLDKEDYSIIQKILNARKHSDFIPTPLEFLKPFLQTLKDRNDDTFLEPSCGLGFVIHHVLKINPNIKITAYEFNNEIMELLRQLFPEKYYPNITFHRKNFLEANEKGNYSIIFCNPPFTLGTDSRFYINFFFECNKISINSDSKYHDNLLYFISPPLYQDFNPIKNTYIDPSQILTSSYLNKKRIEDILNKEITTKQFNEFKKDKYDSDIYRDLEDYEPAQVTYLETVQFTAGTKFKAYSYECINVNGKIYGGKLRMEFLQKKRLKLNK